MTKSPLKVGMVGAGYILKSHAVAVSALKNTVLHSVADVSVHRAERAASEFGFKQVFSSVDDLADSDCDVVHVLVPPHLHGVIADKLLNAGKSVFLEKPFCISSEECMRLGAKADSRNLRLGINHNFLFLPRYERLRSEIMHGRLGRIDSIDCSWRNFLPQISAGPFDAWMLSAPANLLFELGPHPAAFILDLLGGAQVSAAVASRSIELPSGQRTFRKWSVIGACDAASFNLSIAVTPGQSDRILRVRGSGGSAQLDFGRDLSWVESSAYTNPVFDAHAVGREIARQVGKGVARDRRRRLAAALLKSPYDSPYGESIARSIARFYDWSKPGVDRRHSWTFGAELIELCEQSCAAAGVGIPSAQTLVFNSPAPSATVPNVLVVGATGFIGRRLVANLVRRGVTVRVLSRSRSAAAIAFAGLEVEIHEGSHGDVDVARKAVEGVEAVYHLAKCDGNNWQDYVRGDIDPTAVLAEQSIAAGVKRFIYTGTIDSYNSADAQSVITDSTPLDYGISKRNFYARSKAMCELLLQNLYRDKGLPLVIARPGIVIGEGAPPAHIGVANFISESHLEYWGSGDNKLPLVLVDDVADALARLYEAPGVIGKAFLLTGDPVLTAREYVAEFSIRAQVEVNAKKASPWQHWLADWIKEVAKNLIRHPNRRWPTLHDWRCRSHLSQYDSTQTRRALGWQPVCDKQELIRRGIHEAVDAAIK